LYDPSKSALLTRSAAFARGAARAPKNSFARRLRHPDSLTQRNCRLIDDCNARRSTFFTSASCKANTQKKEQQKFERAPSGTKFNSQIFVFFYWCSFSLNHPQGAAPAGRASGTEARGSAVTQALINWCAHSILGLFSSFHARSSFSRRSLKQMNESVSTPASLVPLLVDQFTWHGC
jgi:hypothetical protein